MSNFLLGNKKNKKSFIKKFMFFTPITMMWIYTFNCQRISLSFYGSIIFACLEMIFYKWNNNVFFTTKEQFIANFISMPFMIADYHVLFPNIYLRHLIFPLNVWLFEIIMGYSMIFLLENNPAWNYNTKYSYFKGQISFECYTRSFFLGILQDFLYLYW